MNLKKYKPINKAVIALDKIKEYQAQFEDFIDEKFEKAKE